MNWYQQVTGRSELTNKVTLVIQMLQQVKLSKEGRKDIARIYKA